MGSNLTLSSTFSANIVGPDPGNPVTAASVRVMGIGLGNRTEALEDGKIIVASGVTMIVASGGEIHVDAGGTISIDGALVSNGSAEFNGTGGDKTTIAQLEVGDAGAAFTGPLTGQVGEFTWPAAPGERQFSAQENSGATVSASCAFTMTRSVTVSAAVSVGGTGYETPVLWITPSVPWILEGMALQITATSTSDADPGDVTFYVYVDGLLTALVGTMSGLWGAGTTYIVDDTTSNPVIFGLKAIEKGTLLTPPFASSGLDDRGLALDEENLAVVALTPGDTFGLLGKPITIRVGHSSASVRTLNIPLRLIAWGRLL